ncbi:hypothetical protein BGZ98_007882 [Dissophora globulifera]|nr:hypothetical protein BGZ98_007882 [Dissophora globulifera]
MFRLVNKRLAANRELESLKQEFNQCSLPIEFVYRIVVACVDEIMERGLNHPFILKNPYPPSVVAAMLTLMADPDRRDLFSLKCMRIDTVAGVMLAVLKNMRQAIVPMEIQEELTFDVNGLSTSVPSTPTLSSQSLNKINTVNSLLNHPNFPAVNRALLMELLNLSLAILNRSSFNRVKPDMLASVLGPHIFATQHATILQHTPQQAYSFGWGVALVNDIKRCSKMFYVLLGGYRREILGPEEWEFDQGFNVDAPSPFGISVAGAHLSGSLSRGQVSQWLGSTATIHGSMNSAGMDPEEDRRPYFGQGHRPMMHQSVPQLRVITESVDSPRNSLSRYGMIRNVSTTLSESIRAAAAQEAKHWPSSSGSKGPAALEHLRGGQNDGYYNQQQGEGGYSRSNNGSWTSRQQQQRQSTVEQRQQELFDRRFRSQGGRGVDGNNGSGMEELSKALQRHRIQSRDGEDSDQEEQTNGDGSNNNDMSQREQKRQAIERMIRECRGTGLSFEPRDQSEMPGHDVEHTSRQSQAMAF